MTPVQIQEQFGEDNLPQIVKDALKNNNKYSQQMTVIWLVMPNDKRIPGMPGNKNMPYTSLYWLEGHGSEYLYCGGFEEFPVPVARYQVNGQDAYGRGPGWYARAEAGELATKYKRTDYMPIPSATALYRTGQSSMDLSNHPRNIRDNQTDLFCGSISHAIQ